MRFGSRGYAADLLAFLAGTASSGSGCARPGPPQKGGLPVPASGWKFVWSKVADASKAPNRKGPGCLETGASRVLGAKEMSFPKQDALG